MINLQEIGMNIKISREKSGLSLLELAGKIDKSKSTLSKIENGKQLSLDIQIINDIVEALNLDINDIIKSKSSLTKVKNQHKASKIIQKVGENYLEAKQEEFAGHEIANEIRSDLPKILREEAKITDDYLVVGSPGKGQWSEIPWCSIYDKDITTTATFGFYIVYLFTADMKGVYLSLNQGWTFYQDNFKTKEGRKNAQKVAYSLRELINAPLKKFDTNITLNGRGALSKGYEAGHIMGKYYSFDNKIDDATLISDLNDLLGIYKEIKGLMGDMNYDDFVRELIDIDIEIELEKPEQKKRRKTISTALNTKLQSIKNKRNKETGTWGEEYIFKKEIQYLIDNNREDLASNVEWISNPEDGVDGSVDIKSFFLDGSVNNIEVKSSSMKSNDIFTFYISKNEVQIALENPGNYTLILVDNVHKGQDGEIKGNIIARIKDPFEKDFKLFVHHLDNGISIEANDYICKYNIPK